MGEVQGLVANLVAMHDLLRDRDAVSVRLVMTPDRMVVAEAMRTFTYLSLYGYLTDAVVVNRVFPEELDGTYFGAWRARQQEELVRVREGFAPVPVLRAPYFEAEVIGAAMLDRLADAVFGDGRPGRAAAHRARAGVRPRRRRRVRAPRRAVRRARATCRSRRSATSWSCASTAASARSCCRRRSPRCGRLGRRSTTVPWWCALPERDDLDAVRAHLDEAHAAADRLVREAQRQAEEAGDEAGAAARLGRARARRGAGGRARPQAAARAARRRARRDPGRALAPARRGAARPAAGAARAARLVPRAARRARPGARPASRSRTSRWTDGRGT